MAWQTNATPAPDSGLLAAMTAPESPEAMLHRAQELLTEDDGPKGQKRFFELVNTAAELGLPDAMLEVAVCYQEGTGVKRDPRLAFTWMERAAEAGLEGARLNLAHFYELGIGTKKDLARAAEVLRRKK